MDLVDWKIYAINTWLVMAILFVVGRLAVVNAKKIPGPLQNATELVVTGLKGLFTDALGPYGQNNMPLAITLFLFILLSNIIGQFPLTGFGHHTLQFKSPTATPSTTVGLGTMVFLYVQYVGIKHNGFWGYLKHFAGPMAALAILMFPIEVISEIAKPFSLGMRLFGNIYAEDLINGMATKGGAAWWIPTQIPVYFMQLFTDVVQAIIFSLLTCAYISLMTPDHHDEEHDPGGAVVPG
jgi:F-type H+-transporting ATPase subunit a